jgi:hypothetical protein
MIARIALPALSSLLLLVILAEWLIPGGIVQLNAQPSASAASHRKPSAILNLGDASLADRILERPLFLTGRRMAPPVTAEAQLVAAKATPLPRLSGIFLSGTTRVAIFQVQGAAKPVTAGVGDVVSAWTITEIKPDEVSLKGASGITTLVPSTTSDSATTGADAASAQSGDEPSDSADQ